MSEERTYSQAEVDAILKAAYPIMGDGPHKITDHRRWLARQLLDSKLSEEEAYGIVRYSPGVNPAPTSANLSPRDVVVDERSASTEPNPSMNTNKSEGEG